MKSLLDTAQKIAPLVERYPRVILLGRNTDNIVHKIKEMHKCNEDKVLIINKQDAVDFKEVQALYYLYEFSDKLKIFEYSSQYPSLFNYVEQGLLTEDEMIEALLY